MKTATYIKNLKEDFVRITVAQEYDNFKYSTKLIT